MAIPSIGGVVLLLVFLYLIFGVLGVQIFQGRLQRCTYGYCCIVKSNGVGPSVQSVRRGHEGRSRKEVKRLMQGHHKSFFLLGFGGWLGTHFNSRQEQKPNAASQKTEQLGTGPHQRNP